MGNLSHLRTPQDEINTWFNERVNIKADFKEALDLTLYHRFILA